MSLPQFDFENPLNLNETDSFRDIVIIGSWMCRLSQNVWISARGSLTSTLTEVTSVSCCGLWFCLSLWTGLIKMSFTFVSHFHEHVSIVCLLLTFLIFLATVNFGEPPVFPLVDFKADSLFFSVLALAESFLDPSCLFPYDSHSSFLFQSH